MATTEREKPKHDTVMDVTEERIARVYAQAFIGVAAKSPDASATIDEVASVVADVLDRVPRLDETFRSELITAEDKQRLLDRAFSNRSSTSVLHFLKVLAAHGRLGLLRPIVRILRKLDAERRGLVDVEIRVAMPIDPALQADIEGRLRAKLSGEPVMHVIIDPSLIAGFIVRVGDRVFDGSIHTQLEHARRAMIERATERIETQPDRFLSSTV
jgi:F-type H+-transporting ATPase subunit delta